MNIREKIYRMLTGTAYGIFMMICIVISLIPLAFKGGAAVFTAADLTTTVIFIIDYAARWITADLDAPGSKMPFALYPMRPMAIIDLVSILPSVTVLNNGFRLLRLFRLMRTLKVFRAFKLARYSKNFQMIGNVFRKQKDALLAVLGLSAAYVLISALIVFNVEPDTFSSFFEAVYWATVSLTTMGYGDIYPVSAAGRIVTMISSLFGIAIVALPAGILTAGYMEELTNSRKDGA